MLKGGAVGIGRAKGSIFADLAAARVADSADIRMSAVAMPAMTFIFLDEDAGRILLMPRLHIFGVRNLGSGVQINAAHISTTIIMSQSFRRFGKRG
jgi:hypothetical protein